MALLKYLDTGTRHNLSARHLVGRAATCSLTLDDRRVSGEHAVLCWTGSRWELQDLGSRNGTFLGGERIQPGLRVPLAAGDRVAFGDADNSFELIDASPPQASAVSEAGDWRDAEVGLLTLPDDETPLYTIFEVGAGRWVAESSTGERTTLADRGTLQVGDKLWTLHLPTVLEVTLDHEDEKLLHEFVLTLRVSRDEEEVKVSLVRGTQVVSLESRAHHYLLLTLARARVEDQQNPALSEAEHGWVYMADLVRMLGGTNNQVNVSIYRARRQLARLKVVGATSLLERRPQSKQIRIGVAKIEISGM